MDYKRIKKNDLKKWLLGGNAKIYGLILIVLLAAVLFMFKTVNSMFTSVDTSDQNTDQVEEQQSTTAFVEDSQSYMIKINKAANFVSVYKMNSDGDFDQAYKAFRCSVHANVALGDTTISDKFNWRKLAEGSFGHYATKLDNGITISSIPYYAQDISRMNVSAYNNLGNTGKYGDVCLASADAQWIYENCGKSVAVSIYEDATEQPPIDLDEFKKVSNGYTYDPTDTNSPVNNKSSDVKIDFMRGVEDCTIPVNSTFDQWEGIYARDMNGNEITSKITIKGTVDVTTPGTYTLIYYLSDNFGTNLAYYRYVTVTE